jgi:trehalose/maltose hydrolase-like predicted phosphorylase
MSRKVILYIISVISSVVVAKAESEWTLRAQGACPDYTGASAANGTIGVLHWKDPFSVRQIVLNNVFELSSATKVNTAVLGINPFNISVSVDGLRQKEYTDWSQEIDMRNAEHRTSCRYSGKVAVSYSLIALRNLPHVALFKVKVKALEKAEVTFTKSFTLPSGYVDAEYSSREFYADKRKIRLQQMSARTEKGRYDVSSASMFIYDTDKGVYDVSGEKTMLKFALAAGDEVEFAIAGSVCTTSEYSDPFSEAQRVLIYLNCSYVYLTCINFYISYSTNFIYCSCHT